MQVRLGFNDFQQGVQELQLAPTCLWRAQDVDWWATETFTVGCRPLGPGRRAMQLPWGRAPASHTLAAVVAA